MNSRLHVFASRGWFGFITNAIIIVMGVVIVGLMRGLILAHSDIRDRDALIQQIRTLNQEITAGSAGKTERIDVLQAKLASVQAALDAIQPSKNAYYLRPNQSIVVAGGQLIIGLVGTPTNQGVNVNVNGKQRLAAPGDIISVTPDASTTCQVTVQSFDMFTAVLTGSCAAVKPQ